MKDFKILFSFLTVFLFLFSCQSSIDDSLVESDIVDGFVESRHDGQFQSCNCYYRVTHVILDAPFEDLEFELNFGSQAGACIDEPCTPFLAGSAGACNTPLPNCETDLNPLNPLAGTPVTPLDPGLVPFNCSVEPFLDFDINFTILCCDDDCNISGTYSGWIFYDILCEGIEPKARCVDNNPNSNNPYPYYFASSGSEHVYWNDGIPGGLINVALTECGCTPTFY